MSNQQQNAWQTASRSRHSHSASRVPQNRSGTESPSQQSPSIQPSRQDGGRPQQQVNNVWTQHGNMAGGSNGQARTESSAQGEEHMPVNSFNAAEVKSFLERDPAPVAYKPTDAIAAARSSGGAWGSKSNHISNNQTFFVQLAKQIATIEGGG